MIIENPEYIMGTSIDGRGPEQPVSVVLPKGLPGKNGAMILMVSNLKYFLEMFTLGDYNRYFRPYEILADLEKQVMEDAIKGEIASGYFASYKRAPMSDGEVIFDFSHFEVNTETEPDENYRSLYIYFEYTGSAS
jgi:hypothetical protein